MSDATINKRLAVAHARVVEAKAALTLTAAAAEAARKFAAEVTHELTEHAKKNEAAAALRAASLMRSLKLGGKPAFRKSPALAAARVDLAEAQQRADVARRALAELVQEEIQAQRELDEAVAGLHAEVRGILIGEGEAIVAQIEKLEAEAMKHRVELEGISRSGIAGWGFRVAISDRGKRMLTANELTRISVKQDPLWHAANAAAEQVRVRYDSLLQNPVPASA